MFTDTEPLEGLPIFSNRTLLAQGILRVELPVTLPVGLVLRHHSDPPQPFPHNASAESATEAGTDGVFDQRCSNIINYAPSTLSEGPNFDKWTSATSDEAARQDWKSGKSIMYGKIVAQGQGKAWQMVKLIFEYTKHI